MNGKITTVFTLITALFLVMSPFFVIGAPKRPTHGSFGVETVSTRHAQEQLTAGEDVRKISYWLHRNFQVSGGDCRVKFAPPGTKTQLHRNGEYLTLTLNASEKDWFHRPENFRAVCVVVLGASLTKGEVKFEAMPPWLQAAAYHGFLSRRSSEKMFVGNRPMLEAAFTIMIESGNFDFAALIDLEKYPEFFSERVALVRLSRLLWEGLRVRCEDEIYDLLDKRFNATNAGDYVAINAEFRRAVTAKLKAKDFNTACRSAICDFYYNDFNPRRAEDGLAELAEIRKSFTCPELDAEMKPTGKSVTMSLEELAMKIATRPDAAELRERLIKRLISFIARQDRAVKFAQPRVLHAARFFGDGTPPNTTLLNELDKMERQLIKRREIDDFLRKSERGNLTVLYEFRHRLAVFMTPPESESEVLSDWLNKINEENLSGK